MSVTERLNGWAKPLMTVSVPFLLFVGWLAVLGSDVGGLKDERSKDAEKLESVIKEFNEFKEKQAEKGGGIEKQLEYIAADLQEIKSDIKDIKGD